MRRLWGHTRTYHEHVSLTPVVDVVACVVGVASVVVGGHAGLFLGIALLTGDGATAVETVPFFVAIAVANGLVEVLRHWRRHHG
jgi:uncharacterized membrane protein YfcA